jgi:hypothetical protein
VSAGEGAGESPIRMLEIMPERIKPVRRGTTPAAQGKPVTAVACLEWGAFAGPEIPRVEAAVEALDLAQLPVKRAIPEAGGYWVFMPPLQTKAEVDKKIGELKTLGVTDFYVVQEAGQWRNAISLGIFKSEEAAKSFLAALRNQGVRSAVIERRENFLKQFALVVRDPSEATVAQLAEGQRQFPGTEIRAIACPAGT